MITLERHSLLSQSISTADSREALARAMARLPAQFGFKYFTLMNSPAATDTLIAPLAVETTFPANFVTEFDELKLLKECPLAPMMKNMVLPLCWSCHESVKEGRILNFSPRLLAFLGRHEISTGVAMPLYSADGSVFMMRLDGDRPMLTLPELNEVGMLFLHAFTMFDRLRRQEPVQQKLLTVRELEVVRWTSQGKTSSEIASILSLSDHTVNAYLNKAIKKLDCVNRTQLVAKAIRLRLIS
ncbi:DNA-binding transcriptional regulator, CsgD family [Rhizobium sp. RU35A]|uniref:LuxR family transcriptional regulator n=1 Tax=Rhizobium straminoryzae TaxID=1387186 RepID=A0A549TDH0_9HYPH|nr:MULTISPECIES: LuxR C-terminal-related transcriptional regulator [Rhizobium]TRL40085.1 LuxR family transcriptional regulator [Rhizobium straminoryzae]SIQ21041.1 DNA-binding transcriptional regulator, CsgD family [Rhizobium sp. RU35A]